MKITKGQIVAITTGEYSDYCLDDHMRASKDFDTAEEIARFKQECNHRGEEAGQRPFLAWAIREFLMEPTERDEVRESSIYAVMMNFQMRGIGRGSPTEYVNTFNSDWPNPRGFATA